MRRLLPLLGSMLLLTGFFSCPERPAGLRVPAATLFAATDVLAEVDPFIGSGGFPWARGNVSPAASVPFGRVRLGPDTTLFGRPTSTSGYGGLDTHVRGFSHTRLSGTGAFEGGLLRVLPLTGTAKTFAEITQLSVVLDKGTERASPGYYSVYLPGPRVQAEMTASARTGLHRYSFFRSGESRRLLIHLNSGQSAGPEARNLQVQVDAAAKRVTLQGRHYDAFSRRYEGLPFFVVFSIDTSWTAHRFLSATSTSDAASWSEVTPDGARYLELEFAPSDESGTAIEVRAALSHASLAGAERNLAQESTGRDFDALLASAQTAWRDLIGRIEIEGGTSSERHIFRTALYHSFLMPTLMDDPNGGSFDYLGFDGTVRSAAHNVYSDFSVWDTFRTLHPLYHLLLRDQTPAMLSSLLLMAEQMGTLPRWPAGVGNANSMIGVPSVMVLSDAALKEVSGWDQDLGYAWSKKMTTSHRLTGQECLEEFLSVGYCPGLVPTALELAYALESHALWSEKRSESAEAERGHRQARAIENHWSSSRGFFVPVDANGTKDEGISEEDSSYLSLTRAGKRYVEGTAWHWAFSPFLLADQLLALDPTGFHARLERFLVRGGDAIGSPWPVHGYWHGNEHDYHAPYLFALTGRADLTQKWVAHLRATKYADQRLGLDGDDDGGAISSWYVWSALGLFPVAGSDRYVLGTPLFARARVRLDAAGTKFLTITRDGPADTPYLAGASLAGEALASPVVTDAQIRNSAELHFTRSAEARSEWGTP